MDRAVAVAQHPLPMAMGMLAGAAPLIHRALEPVQRDSHDEGRLLPEYSRAVYFEGADFEAARDAYTRALTIAHRENDAELELRTLGNAANVDSYLGNYQELMEKSLRGLELASGVHNPWAELALRYYASAGKFMTGDFQGAKPHRESMRDLSERLQDRFWLATAFFPSAQAPVYEGDWDAARHFSDQGLALLSMDCRCLAPRIQLEFELGEFEQSEAYLERLLDAMRLTPPGPNLEYTLGIPLAA